MAFLREQIKEHGDRGHPLHGVLEYDMDNDMEILIKKMPEDPDGLDWSQLLSVLVGLWEYVEQGMRYRTATFDVLDIEDDAQIGWGHIVKLERDSLSNRNTKRGLQLSSPTLPSSANLISGQRNSSMPSVLDLSVDWRVEDSDVTLRFTPVHTDRGGRQFLDPEAVHDLFVDVIGIIQDKVATEGEEGVVGGKTIRYGRLVELELINSPHMLTWGHLATVVLGLVEYIVERNHYRTYYFTIYVGDPMMEIAIGKIVNGIVPHNNVTVARRYSVKGGQAG